MTHDWRRALAGVLQIARGRPGGIEQFGATPEAFVASFAPLVLIQVAQSAWLLSRGDPGGAVWNLIVSVVPLLTAPVLSHALARGLGREAEWLRYAVAYNWSVVAIPLSMVVLVPATVLFAAFGFPAGTAALAIAVALATYLMWLHWFVARHALALPGWRALALSLAVDLGTVMVLFLLAVLLRVLGGGGAS